MRYKPGMRKTVHSLVGLEKDIGALISDYFESNRNDESNGNDCKSPDESAHNNEGAK